MCNSSVPFFHVILSKPDAAPFQMVDLLGALSSWMKADVEYRGAPRRFLRLSEDGGGRRDSTPDKFTSQHEVRK